MPRILSLRNFYCIPISGTHPLYSNMQTQEQVTSSKGEAPGDLMRRTLEELRKDSRGLLSISIETGIPYFWLKKFKAGEIPNPSVNRVEALFKALTGKALKV